MPVGPSSESQAPAAGRNQHKLQFCCGFAGCPHIHVNSGGFDSRPPEDKVSGVFLLFREEPASKTGMIAASGQWEFAKNLGPCPPAGSMLNLASSQHDLDLFSALACRFFLQLQAA